MSDSRSIVWVTIFAVIAVLIALAIGAFIGGGRQEAPPPHIAPLPTSQSVSTFTLTPPVTETETETTTVTLTQPPVTATSTTTVTAPVIP